MVPEKQIQDFVSRLRAAAGGNLESVVLYGSAASGEFHPEFSNINLLCILQEVSYVSLSTIAATVEWWTRQKYHPPLVLTRQELLRAADVFCIELLDMKERHRVLCGDDPLSVLEVPLQLHRAQLEYELREKLILLRENLLLVRGQDKQQWELMLHSISTFATLFRHVLIVMGGAAPKTKRETIQTLATRISFDPSPLLQLLDIREHKAERKQFDVKEVFARYLEAVQHVIAAVDTM